MTPAQSTSKVLLVVALSRTNSNFWTTYCNALKIDMYVNIYDAISPVDSINCSTALTFRIRGGKALFWKRSFVNERTMLAPRIQYIWFMDEDIRYYDVGFSGLDHIMRVTQAAILQPTVVPLNHNKFSAYMSNKYACLVHTTSFVEVQAPIFTKHAWIRFHTDVVMQIADDVLNASDWLDSLWCKYAEMRLNASCVYSRATTVKHLNSKTLDKAKLNHAMPFQRLSRRVSRYVRFPGGKERTVACFDQRFEEE